MKKIMAAALVVFMAAMSGSAFADLATSNIQVSANVVNVCRVTSTSDITFVDYDPTDTNPNDSGTGAFAFRCTKGTAYNLYITGTRTMTLGLNNLPFEIYTTAGRTITYPALLADAITGTSSNNAPITQNLYGRIAAGVDVPLGNYTQTLVVTVEY